MKATRSLHRRALTDTLLAASVGSLVLATLTPAWARGAPEGHRVAIAATDWAAYLGGPLHDSFASAETTITPANAAATSMRWEFSGGGGYLSSPIVFDGAVYIGANNGWFYELSATSGHVLHKIFLGTVNITSCPPPPTGMVSTATVATDTVSGQPTIYASGANGYLYALRPSTLGVKWRSVIAIPSRTVNDYFDWSSPTVSHGRIYLGISSNCDSPLVRAGVVYFDQHTGKKLQEFFTVPKGAVGGSVWSSVAVASNGDVYAATGNGPLSPSNELLGDSDSIIKLSPTLRFLSRFQVPASQVNFDGDFGASPVLFDGLVGACNKNGIFYALHQTTMRVAWERTISGPAGGNEECDAAPVWNGRDLYLATPAEAVVGNTSYEGSVQERTPGGTLVWISGLPSAVDGSPTMDRSGVLAVGTFDSTSAPNETYLMSASTGKILSTVVEGADFAQSVFAEGGLFSANENGVYGWRS